MLLHLSLYGPSTEPCGTPLLLLRIENQHRRNSETFFFFLNLVRYVKWVWPDLVCTSQDAVMMNTFSLSPKDFRKLKAIPLFSPLFQNPPLLSFHVTPPLIPTRPSPSQAYVRRKLASVPWEKFYIHRSAVPCQIPIRGTAAVEPIFGLARKRAVEPG